MDRLARVVLAGFGSEYRLDDGVGPLVAARAELESEARDVGPLSDPLDLLGHWNGAQLVIVIDAVRSGVAPGTVRVVELDVDTDSRAGQGDQASVAPGTTSTHGLGLEGVLRLARAIGQAPKRLVVVGVEGERFGVGEGLSPAVVAAVPDAVRAVVELAREA
jgi:hydrogenase maturation protease